MKAETRRGSLRLSNGRALLSFGDRITFVGPVCAEIVDNVEDLQLLESHPAEIVVCGRYIWTLAPGTTSTIEHDVLRPRQGFSPLAKSLDAFGTRGRTDVFRSRDVCLGIEHLGTNVKDQRLVPLGGQYSREFRRLNEI